MSMEIRKNGSGRNQGWVSERVGGRGEILGVW